MQLIATSGMHTAAMQSAGAGLSALQNSPLPARALQAHSRCRPSCTIRSQPHQSSEQHAAALRQQGAAGPAAPLPPPLPQLQHATNRSAADVEQAQQAHMPLECRPQQLQAALPRRQLLALACCAAAAATVPTYPASASGILQLPVDRLSNTYFLVRAGQSEAEAAGYVLTNPVRRQAKPRARCFCTVNCSRCGILAKERMLSTAGGEDEHHGGAVAQWQAAGAEGRGRCCCCWRCKNHQDCK